MGRLTDVWNSTKNYFTKDNSNTQQPMGDLQDKKEKILKAKQERAEQERAEQERAEQEEILKNAQERADELKKNLAKKRTNPKEEDFQQRENSGIFSRGLSDKKDEEIVDIMPSFGFIPESKSTGVIDKFKEDLFKKDINKPTFEINPEENVDMPIIPSATILETSTTATPTTATPTTATPTTATPTTATPTTATPTTATPEEPNPDLDKVILLIEEDFKRVTPTLSENDAIQKLKRIGKLGSSDAKNKYYEIRDRLQPLAKEKKPVLSRWGTNLKEGLLGTPVSDLDYAYKSGYTGASKESMLEDITSYKRQNVSMEQRVIELQTDIDNENERLKLSKDELYKAKGKDKEPFFEEVRMSERRISKLEKERNDLINKIEENKGKIKTTISAISDYERRIIKEKEKVSAKASTLKKLKQVGDATDLVTSGLYNKEGGFGAKKDWFGKGGVLSAPYKQSTVTTNPVSAPNMQNLGYITKSTGSTAGRTMTESITTIRANKNIAPMGMSGTIYGARQQFDYNIPTKKIMISDVSKTNINPDILPNIFSPPKQVQQLQEVVAQTSIPQEAVARTDISQAPVSFRQVTQPDGTVVNVPVHYRKSVPVTVISRRFTHNVKIPAMKSFGNDSRINRGIISIGSYKPSGFSSGLISQFKQVAKPVVQSRKSTFFTVSVNRYPHGTDVVTKPRKNVFGSFGLKSFNIVPEGKVKFTLGLLNINDMDMYGSGSNKVGQVKNSNIIKPEYRSTKKSSPLTNMKSILNVGSNLSKMISKRKMKSGKV